MTHKNSRFATVSALIAAALLASACAHHKVNNDWPNDVNKTYHAVVKTSLPPQAPPDPAGDLARLKGYYKELQNLVGVTNLEEQQIGCALCGLSIFRSAVLGHPQGL